MSEYRDTTTWVPIGWKCPVCKRVFSPSTTMCMFCGGVQKEVVNTTETTVDWTLPTTITGNGSESVTLKEGEEK